MGYYDYNYLTALEKVTNHHVEFSSTLPRERYWRIRSKKVILAQGAFERPLVFADNDRPGIMMASADAIMIPGLSLSAKTSGLSKAPWAKITFFERMRQYLSLGKVLENST